MTVVNAKGRDPPAQFVTWPDGINLMQLSGSFRPWGILCLSLSLILPVSAPAKPDEVMSAAGSLAPMLEKALPAIVSIVVTALSDGSEMEWQTPDQLLEGYGSGVIIDDVRGLILTNAHVIDQATTITIRLNDGRKAGAVILGADYETDLAVLQINLDGLTAIPVGSSAALRVGDQVVAVGDAFGLDQTVTTGIVSALGRKDLGIQEYEDFIQVDATLSPGNSGGPLLDMAGRMVGINTAMLQPDGGGIGIGFAIPADMAMLVAHQLIADGKMYHGAIGVTLQDLTPELAEALGITGYAGVLISDVLPGTPAERIGLHAGDLLMTIDGVAVTSAAEMRNFVGLSVAGTRLTLSLRRKGKNLTADIVLGALNEIMAQRDEGSLLGNLLSLSTLDGATFSNAPPGPFFAAGVVIETVDPGGSAGQGGLLLGDVIVSVNGIGTPDIAALTAELLATNAPRLLRIYRDGKAMFIVIR